MEFFDQIEEEHISVSYEAINIDNFRFSIPTIKLSRHFAVVDVHTGGKESQICSGT